MKQKKIKPTPSKRTTGSRRGGGDVKPENGEQDVDVRACRVKVTLSYVQYVGPPFDDIGSDWEYELNVNGRVTEFPKHRLRYGGLKNWNRVIFDDIEGVCGGFPDIKIAITASELDNIGPDDTGSIRGVTPSNLSRCPSHRRDNFIVVRIPGRSVFGAVTTELARLDFYFEIKSVCVKR